MSSYKELTEKRIRNRLQSSWSDHIDSPPINIFEFLNTAPAEPTPAAVLMPLLKVGDSWELLFTRRLDTLPEHSGQVAFPGGRCDPGDIGPEQAALRETEEEIGIKSADVRILGRVNRFLTVTNYLVTPIVGIVPWPYPLVLAEAEVSHTFTIPLKWLANRNNRYQRTRTIPHSGQTITAIYFKDYYGEVLWGASARFTVRLIDMLTK